MQITIWGARGSTPTPIRPDDVREKIISALLSVSQVESGEFREKLISAILENVQTTTALIDIDTTNDTYQLERRKTVESYLEKLSPLAGQTASGNTPCVQIQSGKDLFIIDAGSGIRELGLELMKGDCGQGQGTIHLFFSHPHWDHIQGFPFFRPAFVPGNKIFIYGIHDMEAALRRQQEAVSFPVALDYMQATMEFVRLQPEEMLEFGELRIRNMLNHHPGEAYAFRFEKGDKAFVYASDSAYPSGIDLAPYKKFFNRADVVIFDSQFTQRESDEKEDWGHSSSFFGVEMAQESSVKELVLFHYDPTYSDLDLEKILQDTLKFQYNQYPARDPIKISIAHEGQTFDLTPAPMTQLHHVPGGKVAILKPAGIFDEAVAAELAGQLTKLRQQHNWPPQLIVDMSAVELLQVSGLRVLVKLRKEQQGTPMVLAGPSISVQQLIELAGYLDFFAIYPSVHVALNALKAHETLNLPGQMIKHRYSVNSKIGDGRLGTVFKATDTRHDKPVALKVLSASFSEGAIEQFLGHARQIIDLSHPNVVDIYDCDEDRGLSYMIEEFIEGRTLRDLIDETPNDPLPLDVALSIAENITQGLEYAHSHEVIHGDLKPKNVLLHKKQVKISDFGLGRLESGNKSLINIDVPLAMITARYVAPEQVLGHPIDARTDLYALGAILYELFTGHPLFEGSEDEVLQHQRTSAPRSPREFNPNLSYSLEHLILKLLDKDPNKRYAKASQVRRILASMITTSAGTFVRPKWPTLAGDEGPLHQLTEAWATTKQGQGQLVLLTGGSGVGKTRLTQELAQQVGEATLLMGKCRKFEGGSAFQPLLEALHGYFASTPADIAQGQVAYVLQQLSQFIPEIGAVIAETHLRATNVSLARLDNPSNNLEAASLAELIKQATQQLPWVIIIDDLQWADRSTIHLFDYLSRHCESSGFMLVGVYQSDLILPDTPIAELLENLKQGLSPLEIELRSMTALEIEHLLENLWQQNVPQDLAAAIYRRSKGNPFHAEEIAKGLVDDEIVSWRDNKWHFAPVLESGLPRDLSEAILRRLNRLTKETQTLLHQAAILGRTFEFEHLHEMSDLSRWDALESLDIALERQLIIDVPAEGVLRFKHAEIQHVFYHNLSHLKQQLMHRETGEALERYAIAGGQGQDISAPAAHHFYQAGEYKKALLYSRQAAQQAETMYANQTALIWYTQALDALDHLNQAQAAGVERFDLLLAREQILNQQGDREAQARDLSDLQTLAQNLDDPLKQALVHNRQAAYDRMTSQFKAGTTEAQAALIAARQAKSPILEAESLTQLVYLKIEQGDFAEALAHIQVAQNNLGDKNDQWPLARFLHNILGTIYAGLNDYDQAIQHYEQALTLHQSSGHWADQAITLNAWGRLYCRMGGYSQAKTWSKQALEINRMIGAHYQEAVSLQNLAVIYQAMGQVEMAYRYLDKSLPLWASLKDQKSRGDALRTLGTICRTQEDHKAAQQHLAEALKIAQTLSLSRDKASTQVQMGLNLEQTDTHQAVEYYEQARQNYQALSDTAGVLEANGGVARCLLAEDRADEAQEMMQEGLRWLKSNNLAGINDPIHLYLTIYRVLRATNQTDEAKEALEICQTLIQERADHIGDEALRASYLESVPEDQQLSKVEAG